MFTKPMERKATGGRERPLELPERWSAGQKAEVVLRLLRGWSYPDSVDRWVIELFLFLSSRGSGKLPLRLRRSGVRR